MRSRSRTIQLTTRLRAQKGNEETEAASVFQWSARLVVALKCIWVWRIHCKDNLYWEKCIYVVGFNTQSNPEEIWNLGRIKKKYM